MRAVVLVSLVLVFELTACGSKTEQASTTSGGASRADWFPGSSSVMEEEVIPKGFRGQWAPSKAECTDPDGVEIMSVYPQGIDFYESGGRLDRVTQAGQDRTILMKLSFEGEGGFWDRVWTAALSSDGRSVFLRENGKKGGERYVKCDATPS